MRQISLITELQNKYPNIEDITDQLPRHSSKTWIMRNPESIDSIVIHHAASEAPIENQARFHVNSHNWAGIGYHLVIYKGRIYQTNDMLAESAHCKGHNNHTIGICILGDLSKRSITQIESELVTAAIVTVKSLFDIKEVVGHSQWVSTACPCTSMDKIRDDVSTLELTLAIKDTPGHLMAQVYDLNTRFKDLYHKATTPNKWQEVAIKKLLKVAEVMKKEGLM